MILNDEQKMVQDMLRNYSQNKLKPTAAERDKTAKFPAQELKELGELGALGMTVSEQWGGAGLDYVSLVAALEEIAAGDGALPLLVFKTHCLAGLPNVTVQKNRNKNI